ncbi:MgpC family cytadherence protein [Mycoplasmoides genitalium]|nr:MgpC family cytadherence protein [Mycoplasmoides genitalium]
MKLTYSSSGSNNQISFDSTSQGEKPSYVVEFTNSTNIGIKWRVVKKYQLDVPNVTNEMNDVLKELILEQPLTKYTLNSSLAKEKGKTQREVHLGSGQATNWRSMRNSIGLNDNPSPNASTGFKLDKGNAYRKLSESWPIYQPIDGTKQGKGKDSNGWSSTEATMAAGDAPLSTGGRSSDQSNKFTKYLNTKQALERIGILFDGDGMRNVVTQLYQPNKVKSGQYQQNNTYNRLIEPDNATSAASSMTSLLKLLSSKNIKQKLGKGGTAMQGNNGGGGVSQTINTITTTGNISGNGTIQTAYPVKKDEASNVAINSLINATPLNSYGDLNNASFSK